jgi:hypothetical protein
LLDAHTVIELIGPTLAMAIGGMAWGLIRTHLNKQRIDQLEVQMASLSELPSQLSALVAEVRARLASDSEAFTRNDQAHISILAEQKEQRKELTALRRELLDEIRRAAIRAGESS